MELGMFGGVGKTATMLFDNLKFDLLITSNEYMDLSRPGDLDRGRLAQARAVTGVAATDPLHVGVGQWRLPARRGLFGKMTRSGDRMSINLLGVPPNRVADVFLVDEGKVFANAEEANRAGSKIARTNAFLIDRKSTSAFGTFEELKAIPADGSDVPGGQAGDRNAVRLNGMRAEVVGEFEIGTGFSWQGMLICNEETFANYLYRSPDRVNFGLVHLEAGSNLHEVQRNLKAVLPSDVKVYTREEISNSERRYWLKLTSVGQFLYVAVVLAIVVGIIFVYQMMAADIRNMLPEYATVKALGYRPAYLTKVVLWQAVQLALLGYLPGFVAAFGLFYAAREVGGIPARMTVTIAVEVLLLTLAMCLASGVLAVRRVHSADPADLF
jgi:putative ABC transport system permease protein